MSLALSIDRASARTWAGFAAMGLGMFMAVLDVQIVATALPTIQGALGVEPDAISWVQTAYLMAEVVSIPLTGMLTRALGLRGLVVAALTLFTAASAACAASTTLPVLMACRLVQGFAGGVLIPSVFSAVFLLFSEREQPLATTLAGILAVLAPTIGPIAGGAITGLLSWPWLFLINLLPGVIAASLAAMLLPREPLRLKLLRHADGLALVLLVLALAPLIAALKEAPARGWMAPPVAAGFLVAFVAGVTLLAHCWDGLRPLIAVRLFAERNFAVGCLLNFVFGAGLFGSVYLMPVFLAYVRQHGPIEIGRIMLATGIAQLIAAPAAAALEPRTDPRLLTLFGFLVFAAGLAMSATQTVATDADTMVWPQILRGVGIMFCLVPTTRLALGRIAPARVPDASGLFNLMRNLGGAIGLAAIDSVIYGHSPTIGDDLTRRLHAGDASAARQIGLDPGLLAQSRGDLPPAALQLVKGLVDRAALTLAANEAWAMLAAATLAVTLTLVLARRVRAEPRA